VKIYVASSWRNEFQQSVVAALRSDGHEVYDFKESGDGWGKGGDGPAGFAWSEVDPEWKSWPSNIRQYLIGLEHHRAEEGYRRDMDALESAKACIMVHPCGVSAAMETGWACGAGISVYVYVPGLREPDLMVKMAGFVTDDLELIRASLYAEENDRGGPDEYPEVQA
jgi:hypothetical protein